MSLFKNIGGFISNFKDAVKAGSDFNPLLKEVMDEIETLHAQGKLDDILFNAEQSYELEHAAYQAKGTHTNAGDSKGDVKELEHFLAVLAKDDSMPTNLKEKADRLVKMKEEMMNALGPLGKLL